MKKFICIISIALCVSLSSYAQEIQVKSFTEASEVLWTQKQRLDNNGIICALVRVAVPWKENVLFQGNVVGEISYKGNEYLIYMSKGSRFLRVHYPNYETLIIDFAEYDYKELESKRVYELVLSLPDKQGEGISQEEYLHSQYILGVHYLNNKNYSQAIHHFEIAARNGSPDAQHNLAYCYLETKNYEQAVPWLELAAKQNHTLAQRNLGVHYFNNHDYANAFFWFLEAAKKGDINSMKMLSICYRDGLGVKKSASLAKEWAAKARTHKQHN